MVLERCGGGMAHHIFRDLPRFLTKGDCLVLNDTKVIPARLFGRKADTGGKVELLILRREKDEQGCLRTKPGGEIYRCLGQPARKLKPGTPLVFDHGGLQAEVLQWDGREGLVWFDGTDIQKELAKIGEIPLPPYIGRAVEPADAQWYQTIYAQRPGAVAAPTAGLHFTDELLARIRAQGIRICSLTLHVGWGTFAPVSEEEMRKGRLHSERYRIPAKTIEAIRKTKDCGRRVVAVGTTVVRALETWGMQDNDGASEGETELFIRPGFPFKVVDALITNFHLPGTSLLLLVAAFAGKERMVSAYEEAIRQRYRFYSYGDAMLIL